MLSIVIPDELKSKYEEFPPIFKNTEIELEDIGQTMQDYCTKIRRTQGVKRSLISSMQGDNVVISTPLFKKYISMGLKVESIKWVLYFYPKPCFKWFHDIVIQYRRLSDIDKDQEILRNMFKLFGNTFYGSTLLSTEKHTNIKLTDEGHIDRYIENPLFKTLDKLNDG